MVGAAIGLDSSGIFARNVQIRFGDWSESTADVALLLLAKFTGGGETVP
jgi:hypothetical protein